MKDTIGGGKLGTFGKGLLNNGKTLESRISSNPVKGADAAARKVMESKFVKGADAKLEKTGTAIKKTGSIIATPVTKPVKAIASIISKKLEDTCDVVTTIQASDCEGNVLNTVNLYGCVTNNDLIPIIDVILNKMLIVLWPCISEKNNVVMKFLVNHVLHWVLGWFYIGLIIDVFKFALEEKACDFIDNNFGFAAGLVKQYYGICGDDSIFSHPLSDGWWDTDIHGRCDDNYYRQKCPYNGSTKEYRTDMTLWKGEQARLGGDPGKKNGGFENPGEICNTFADCNESFGGGMGIGVGNAPRKYKECCEFNVRYIVSGNLYNRDTKPGKSMPVIPPEAGAACDAKEFLEGAKTLFKCGGQKVIGGLASLVHIPYTPSKECSGRIGDDIEAAAYQKYSECVNLKVKATGCGAYYSMKPNGPHPPEHVWKTNEGYIHANNSIWQYIIDHPNETEPQVDWKNQYAQVEGWIPATDGKSCDPKDPGWTAEREKDCLGPFRKATMQESMFGGYDCMKDIPIFDLIKYLYKVMFFIFIFLWLFKITDGSAFGRVVLFLLLGAYIAWRVYDIKNKHH